MLLAFLVNIVTLLIDFEMDFLTLVKIIQEMDFLVKDT